MHSQWMQTLLSPHGVYLPEDVDTALAGVFGAGVRPLRIEEVLFEAMLDGVARAAGRALSEAEVDRGQRARHARVRRARGLWPWEWRAGHVDEYFEDLLARPQRLAPSTLRAYQWRLKLFSEYVCDRRCP